MRIQAPTEVTEVTDTPAEPIPEDIVMKLIAMAWRDGHTQGQLTGAIGLREDFYAMHKEGRYTPIKQWLDLQIADMKVQIQLAGGTPEPYAKNPYLPAE